MSVVRTQTVPGFSSMLVCASSNTYAAETVRCGDNDDDDEAFLFWSDSVLVLSSDKPGCAYAIECTQSHNMSLKTYNLL